MNRRVQVPRKYPLQMERAGEGKVRLDVAASNRRPHHPERRREGDRQLYFQSTDPSFREAVKAG